MSRPITISCAVLISTLLASSAVYAAACTYNEAVMAYNNGNLVRGQALMKMAARDGDQRAVRFLVSYEQNLERTSDAGKTLSEGLLVLGSSTTAQTTAKAFLAKARKVN